MLEKYRNHKPLTVNVISDIHYYSKTTGLEGPGFDKANAKTPSELIYNNNILNALCNQLAKDNETDIVLVSGDTTHNGEPESHKECIALLRSLKERGKRVYTITATHDYRGEGTTDKYTKDGTEKIRATQRDELYELYREFGMDEAIALHKESMSYVVQLPDNYRLFALNDDSNHKNGSGFSDELWQWIEEQIKDAHENGQFILPMTHHPMISPSPFYKIIGGGNMMGDHELRRKQFADLGVSYMLTGHTHIQDISYCYSDKGNVFYDITTAAPIAYPGTYRKITLNPAEEKIDVKAVEITEDLGFTLNGKDLKEHLSNKFFGMIKDVIIAAGTDIETFARMATAFSVNPLLIFRIGWIIKPFAKLLTSLKVKHAAFITKKETGLKKNDYKDIADEKIIDFIVSLVNNLYGGDSPYSPDTAYYKITVGVCNILDSILGVFGLKISKIIKGFDTAADIVKPLLYNDGICDAEATLKLFELRNDIKDAPVIVEKKADCNVKKSKKGLGIVIALVLLVILFLPLELLLVLFGFIKNQIKFGKKIKELKG